MKKFLRFIAIGTFFSTVEEFLTVIVLKRDIGSYLFTLLVLFPIFLTIAYFSSRVLDRLIRDQPARDLVYYFMYGFLGLMIEWFLIGLAPWSDPNANPILMIIFQLGMFSFWASVAFTPRLFARAGGVSGQIGKSLLKFYVPYFVIVYFVAFTAPEQFRFAALIPLILFGYLFLNLFYLKYFLHSFAANR